MNILLLYPEFPDTFWSFKHALKFVSKRASLPPLGLLTVAAMLPRTWGKRLVDLNVRRLREADLKWADCVFVSAMAVQREAARQAIERCKAAGLTVVAGTQMRRFEPIRQAIPRLHDGAIGFCEQARAGLEATDFDAAHRFITKAQDIILELSSGLRPERHRELCANLNALYHFLFRQLFEANTEHDPSRLDVVIRILSRLRDGWQTLREKLAGEKQSVPPNIEPGRPMELSA